MFPRKTSAHSEKPAKPHPNMSQSTSHQVFKTARKQTHATVMHPDKIWLANGFSRGGSFEGVSTPQCDLICVRFFFIWLVQLSFLLSPRWKFSKRKTLVPRNVPSQCVYKVLFYFKFYYEIFPPNAIAHEKFLPGEKKLGGTSPLTFSSERKGIPFSTCLEKQGKKANKLHINVLYAGSSIGQDGNSNSNKKKWVGNSPSWPMSRRWCFVEKICANNAIILYK